MRPSLRGLRSPDPLRSPHYLRSTRSLVLCLLLFTLCTALVAQTPVSPRLQTGFNAIRESDLRANLTFSGRGARFIARMSLAATGAWRADVLVRTAAIDEYGVDRKEFPVDAVVALVMTFNEGLLLERLLGIEQGHRALLAWIDGWIESLQRSGNRRKR